MAKPTARETEAVSQWVQTTLILIEATATHASSGEDDPETAAMIRKLRVTCAAFMSALNAVRV